MKKVLSILLIVLLIFSCSKDDEKCEDLRDQYIEALGFAGNSQSAIDEVTRQYNERKDELGCD